MVIDLVSKFIEETRGHPLNVTVPEAQLLHDFATWVDEQAAQHSVHWTLALVAKALGVIAIILVFVNVVCVVARASASNANRSASRRNA